MDDFMQAIVEIEYYASKKRPEAHIATDDGMALVAKLRDATERAQQAETALARRDEPCKWRRISSNVLMSGCGRQTLWGGEFCQFCGHRREDVQP